MHGNMRKRAEEDQFAALAQTVEKRRMQLLRVAQRITRCEEDAEDVVQESVLKALVNLSRFRGEARLDTWLHAIVVNTARTRVRSQAGRIYVPLETDGCDGNEARQLEVVHPGRTPEESCSGHELSRILLAEITAMDPRYGTLIRMCDLDQRSYQETAQALDLSIATVKARLFRARLLLRRKLRRHGTGHHRLRSERKAEVGPAERGAEVCRGVLER